MTQANPTNEPTTEPADNAQQKEPERTFTQADIDAAINARLKDERKKHADELKKFSDYEEVKAKAAKLDEMEAASKSELEKTIEAMNAEKRRAEEAEARAAAFEAKAVHEKLVATVAAEEGVPANLLYGEDEDELRASAQAVKAYVDEMKPKVPKTNAGGATPAPDDEGRLSAREEYAFRAR